MAASIHEILTPENTRKDFVIKKQYFISYKKEDIHKDFEFDSEPLGEGTYGIVYKAVDRLTQEVRAIKKIDVSNLTGETSKCLNDLEESEVSEKNKKFYRTFINELSSLKLLDHPNIIKLHEVYECGNSIYLVQEFCNGGELFDFIVEKGTIDEPTAAEIFKQMVGAIIYCHKNRICHRDLKPENFMLCSNGDGWKVKLIDFGVSRSYFKMEENMGITRMASVIGTTPYMAPEVFEENYSNSCDIWSLGVILYIMVAGYPPFEGDNEEEIEAKIKLLNFSFDDEIWAELSDKVKDLISKLLTEEHYRITPKEALKHEWCVTENPFPVSRDNKTLIDRLIRFRHCGRLRKAVVGYLASKVSDTELQKEIDFFNLLDTNKDGYITKKELEKGLKNYLDIDNDLINSIMASTDTEDKGALSFNEFIAAVLSDKITKDHTKIAQAFQFFNKASDGYITDKQLKACLAGSEFKHIETKVFTEVINEVSQDQNGAIKMKDFMRVMSVKFENKLEGKGKRSRIATDWDNEKGESE
ncbi:unnamed protein product [Moneuplotes crassus]|uniref:Uncharacterized protein n=1 Tax=Euplotes crassus TaxID=5936 RepID=A0AAD1Y568_EUPCR|nr:unnamed protein product [Moneuplotes crassus]